jgi:YgiT-type zinc finger domain-containing protein
MHSESQTVGTIETTCDVCGFESARIRHVPRSYGRGATLLVVENAPVVSCPHCGTSYLTAATMKKIDRIKQNRVTLSQVRSLPVATCI